MHRTRKPRRGPLTLFQACVATGAVVVVTGALAAAVAAESSSENRTAAAVAASSGTRECRAIGAAYQNWVRTVTGENGDHSDGAVEEATSEFAAVVQVYDDQPAQGLTAQLANLSRMIQDAEITPVIQDQVVAAENVVQKAGTAYTTCD